MGVAYADTYKTWDDLVREWTELDVPEGYRPELSTEGILMTPGPGGPHNKIAHLVHRQLVPMVPDSCGLFQTQSVGVRQIGGIYIPDLCALPMVELPEGAEPVLAEHVLLVAEITSRSNADHDRKKKRWAYAHGGIPQYLLIDRHDSSGPTVTLHSDPIDDDYAAVVREPFGKPVSLGDPFGVELDTSEF